MAVAGLGLVGSLTSGCDDLSFPFGPELPAAETPRKGGLSNAFLSDVLTPIIDERSPAGLGVHGLAGLLAPPAYGWTVRCLAAPRRPWYRADRFSADGPARGLSLLTRCRGSERGADRRAAPQRGGRQCA
jgi:hypothetical protein